MTARKSAHDLAGLIKFAGRAPWAEAMDEALAMHLGPVLEGADLEPEDLFDIVDPHWEGVLWGCAFEDLMTQDIEPDGVNIVEEYLKRRGWNEKAPNKTYMQALRRSVMSLYEVSEVVPGQSMKLRDLLREAEPVTVRERSATQTLVNWDRIAARVVEVRGTHLISGALLPFGHDASAALIAGFAANSPEAPGPEPTFDVTDRDELLRHSAPLFTAMWLSDYLGATSTTGLPDLVNADGEDLVFHRIAFPIIKGVVQKDIAARLNAIADLEPAGPRFSNWLVRTGAGGRKPPARPDTTSIVTAMDDGAPVFGTIALEGRRVMLEVNSAERAETARTRAGEWLDGLVGNPLTEIRTLEQMLADGANEPDQEEPALDPHLEEQIVHAMLDREYAKVLDEPVPSLGDETPRWLASTEEGRAKVAEWLKFLENGRAKARDRGDPIASYDFSWMWEELGVADLRK